MNKTSMLDEMLYGATNITIDHGKVEPGMTLQCLEGREWCDYVVDGKMVKTPFDINDLPDGKYRLKK